MPGWKYSCLAVVLAVVGTAQQSLDPGEIRTQASAYLPRPAVTIQARAELVEIGVVVRDSRGRAVGGLTKDDFEVRDENRRRPIAAFSVQTFVSARPPASQVPGVAEKAQPEAISSPRSVAMVFDDQNSPPGDLHYARNAAKHFLDDGLASNDRLGVFTISSGIVLPFTSDKAKIVAAIDGIKHFDHKIQSGSCPLLTPYDAYLIANHRDQTALDVKAEEYASCSGICSSRPPRGRGATSNTTACAEAIEAVQRISGTLWEEVALQSRNSLRTLKYTVDSMARLPGARVILLASSGFLSATLEPEQEEIINQALRANVVINSLDAKGLFVPDLDSGPASPRSATYRAMQGATPKNAANDALAVLADGTGGRFFHNNNDLQLGFKELGMRPETSYLLAVTPEPLDGKYHHLRIRLAGNLHYDVQARRGYVAVAEVPQPPPAPERRIDREVLSADVLREAPATVSVRSAKAGDGRQMAVFTVHVDVGAVRFQERDGARHQRLHVIGVLFDSQNAFVTGTEATLDFALSETSYVRFAKPGLNGELPLQVPEGTYRVRTVVVEGEDDGRYTTKTETVEFK